MLIFVDLPFKDGFTDTSIFHRDLLLCLSDRVLIVRVAQLTHNVYEGRSLPLSTPTSASCLVWVLRSINGLRLCFS
jgi:hypothetical protein